MGVSVDTGGGGRGKSQNFDLNLVPFIDLLSVCITFLLATAVWTQIMALQVDQAIQDPNAPPTPPPETPPTPPLTVHIRADGVWAGRSQEAGQNFVLVPPPAGMVVPPGYTELPERVYDWAGLKTYLETDRQTYPGTEKPEENQVILVTDDGIRYEHMIAALDLTRDLGFDKTLLGGGPAQPSSALPAPK